MHCDLYMDCSIEKRQRTCHDAWRRSDAHETVKNWHPLRYEHHQIALNAAHLNAPPSFMLCRVRHELSGLASDNDAA
jgi:hypothetical protein